MIRITFHIYVDSPCPDMGVDAVSIIINHILTRLLNHISIQSGGMVGLSGSGEQVSSSGGEVNERHRVTEGPEAPKCYRLDKD
jgi:hypothetical protein